MHDNTHLAKSVFGHRKAAGLTQEELARQAGITQDYLGKIENGKRTPSWSTIVKLALVMDLDPGVLVGKQSRLQRVPGGGILGVRNAVLNPTLLPGLAEDTDVEPSTGAQLMRGIERSYGAYFAGEFGILTAEIPRLLAECRATARERGDAEAAAPLSHAWQIAACLLSHTGRDDAAAVAAERAINACAAGDDQNRAHTMLGTYAWVLLNAGRYAESEQLSARAAEKAEPVLSAATPQQMTVWGGLLLHAAVAAGGAGDAASAKQHLRLAKAAATHVGTDRHDYWVSFGPAHLGVQETHIMTSLGRPDAALKAAQRVDRTFLFPIQWGRHRLNEARCHFDRRRTDDAIEIAAEAHAISPEWFGHQGFARTLVDDIANRKARLSSTVRQLVSTVGLN